MTPANRERLRGQQQWWESWARQTADPLALSRYLRGRQLWDERVIQAMVRDIGRKMDLPAEATLLEVGCGSGLLLKGLASSVRWVVGVDFSPTMATRAQALHIPGATFCAAEASRLPFPDQAFDRVLCYNVFTNFPSLQYAAAVVAELVRVARKGGIVLIGQVPNEARRAEWLRRNYEYYKRHASRLERAVNLAHRVLARATRAGREVLTRPTPLLLYTYYEADFFRRLMTPTPHRWELLPSYDFLQEEVGGDLCFDCRFDARIKKQA